MKYILLMIFLMSCSASSNKMSVGDGKSTPKTIEANIGSPNNPYIRFDTGTGNWKLSDDGISDGALDATAKVDKAGDTMTGNLTMSGGATVTGLPSPSATSDAASKDYVDTQVAGAGLGAGNGLSESGGNLNVNVDNSTLEINADTLRVKGSGITGGEIATNTVGYNLLTDSPITNSNGNIEGIQRVGTSSASLISLTSGVVSQVSVTTTAIHTLSISLSPHPSATDYSTFYCVFNQSTTDEYAEMVLERDNVPIRRYRLDRPHSGFSTTDRQVLHFPHITWHDIGLAAGTYSYEIEIQVSSGVNVTCWHKRMAIKVGRSGSF